MEGDEFIMSIGFRNITKCQTKEDVSASDTTILLENTADYVPFTASPGDYVYAVLQNQEHMESVKIDVAASSTNGLSIGRGQENTSARAWKRGTLFYQALTAASLAYLRQKEVFRTFAYNPNGIIAPEYANEKVYQTGDDSCEIRWWKSINDTNLVWMLIVGTICTGEVWMDPIDWDWDIPPAWEWPVVVYPVAPPIFLPPGGTYILAQDVEIFCPTLNSTVYYTDDGSTPDDNSTEYTGLVNVSSTTTLKAIAYKSGFGESPVVTAEYVLSAWDVVASSDQVVVVIMADESLWGWGYNNYYQLAKYGYETTPYQIDGGAWLDVACGEKSTHAIKTDGTLWACGNNSYGQLGVGDTSARQTLTQVGSATNWAKVFSHFYSVYAIKTDGTLWVWGRNDFYALGLGDDTDRNAPVQLGSLTTWSAISCGNFYAIALKTDGTLWAWGLNNGYGQLGLGDSVTRTTPVQIGVSTDWAKLSSKSGGVTLVVKTNGTLWVWGDNYTGQCGQGTSGVAHRFDHPTPTQIGTSTNWKAATPNGSYACMATKTDGTIWAWGSGTYGQLGLGNTTQYTVPMSASLNTDWDYPVGGGPHYTMYAAKTNKRVYSTGYYPQWALGLGALSQDDLEGTPGTNYIHIFTRVDIA